VIQNPAAAGVNRSVPLAGASYNPGKGASYNPGKGASRAIVHPEFSPSSSRAIVHPEFSPSSSRAIVHPEFSPSGPDRKPKNDIWVLDTGAGLHDSVHDIRGEDDGPLVWDAPRGYDEDDGPLVWDAPRGYFGR
jgi:hypothetical protein